jgi:TatD DNase family protein
MYIDSHAHLTSEKIDEEALEGMLQRAQEQQVTKIVNICTDPRSLERGLELSKKEPWIFNTAATTPHDVAGEGELFFPLVTLQAREKNLVAIGETGLDYHYAHSGREIQKEFLTRYLHLALETNLPIVIHCRNAFNDLFEIADRDYRSERLLLHCFTGSLEEAKKGLDRGWSLSMSGIATFKKSAELREIITYLPLDRILVETDTPYLAPESRRGQTNEPSFLPETVALIAQLKGIALSEAASATQINAEQFFSI